MKFGILVMAFVFVNWFCNGYKTGYVKKNGDWFWATIDENYGKRFHIIEGIDQESFKLLDNKNFASDNNYVYFQGKKVNNASPQSFECLTHDAYGYAKDKNHVFFDTEVIVDADPQSFRVLEFPYAKDKNDVYCGMLPMHLAAEDLATFEVVNEDKWMKGTKNTMKIDHFVNYHPAYKWLLDKEIQKVIIGEYGTARSSTKKFRGLYEEKVPK